MSLAQKVGAELESKDYGVKKASVQLVDLEDDHRVTHMVMQVDATVANSAAGAVTVLPRQLAAIFSTILLDSPLFKMRATGRMLWNLYRHMSGKSLSNGGVSVAGGGGTSNLKANLVIPFADPYAADPNGTAQPSELLRKGKALEYILNPSNVIGTGGAGQQTVSAAQIRTFPVYIPGAGKKLPSETILDYEEWGQKTSYIKPKGGFSHLFLWDEADDALTLDEYTDVTARFDGRAIMESLKTSFLVNEFNHRMARGGSQDNELEQLPLSGNLLFLPVLTPPAGYKTTQLWSAEEAARLDFNGTATSARWGYRQVVDTEEAVERDAIRAMGEDPDKVEVEPSTLKGLPLTGDAMRVRRNAKRLPKRLVRKGA